MQSALDRLSESLKRVVDVADDMDLRTLSADQRIKAMDETVRCSCTVILSGFFESFLKECVESFVDKVCNMKIDFDKLSIHTQRRHFVEGGILIGQKMMNKGKVSWILADHKDLAKRLLSPAVSPNSYSLVWEAFANTQSNPGPDVIDSILEGLGVDKRNPRMNLAMNNKYGFSKTALESFLVVRNQCAHTGTSDTIPTPQDLRDYVQLIFDISKAFIDVLNVRITEVPYRLDLNNSTLDELMKVPGLGKSRAMSIKSYISTHGSMSKIDDLRSVPGFGSRTIDLVGMYVTV
jgi:competence ComEA-like helix-hairpin-helix protein